MKLAAKILFFIFVQILFVLFMLFLVMLVLQIFFDYISLGRPTTLENFNTIMSLIYLGLAGWVLMWIYKKAVRNVVFDTLDKHE